MSFPRCLPNTPTCQARRYYEPKEKPMRSKLARVAIAAAAIIVGGVIAGVALAGPLGRRWV